ncbi:MAG: hypothetical protein R2755_28360 [Acidimicrobiales bacterium]
MLLVEDDDGDALLVEELLIDTAEPFRLLRAHTLREALDLVADVDLVLVDLGLLDAIGLGAVERLRCRRRRAPGGPHRRPRPPPGPARPRLGGPGLPGQG